MKILRGLVTCSRSSNQQHSLRFELKILYSTAHVFLLPISFIFLSFKSLGIILKFDIGLLWARLFSEQTYQADIS